MNILGAFGLQNTLKIKIKHIPNTCTSSQLQFQSWSRRLHHLLTHRNFVATSCSRSARSCLALYDQYNIGMAGMRAENDSCTASFVRGCLLRWDRSLVAMVTMVHGSYWFYVSLLLDYLFARRAKQSAKYFFGYNTLIKLRNGHKQWRMYPTLLRRIRWHTMAYHLFRVTVPR